MRHEQVLEKLSEYIEGGLDAATQAAVDNHLRQCEACQDEETSLRGTFAWLDSPAFMVEPPADFHDNAMRRVRLAQREARPQGLLSGLRWAWAAGGVAFAAAVLSMVMMFQWQGRDSGQAAGYTPRWKTEAPRPAAATLPALVITGGPAVLGQDYSLNLDFLAPESGTWRLTVAASSGIQVLNNASEDGVFRQEWPLDSGSRTGLSVALRPVATDAVCQVTVRMENRDSSYAAASTVFVPVGTSGESERVVSITLPASSTLRAVLEDLARVYGVVIVAPDNALQQPVSVELDGVSAREAISRCAAAAGLNWRRTGETYNLHR